MPRPRMHPKRKPVQPSFVILDPSELAALRKIELKEGTSVATIIRRTIHKALYQANPELADRMIDAEVDGFLNRMGEKFLVAGLKGAKRSAFKKQIVKAIR